MFGDAGGDKTGIFRCYAGLIAMLAAISPVVSDGRIFDMPMRRVTITPELRQLIRITRTDRAGMSQRAAANAAGGLSEVWWRQIEAGRTPYATADTLARISYAIGVTPAQLRNIGEDHIAELVEQRMNLLEPENVDVDEAMEAHLENTPGLTEDQRAALLSVGRAFRRLSQ
jgi:transcriptional regulator with XRE-family HTH domain